MFLFFLPSFSFLPSLVGSDEVFLPDRPCFSPSLSAERLGSLFRNEYSGDPHRLRLHSQGLSPTRLQIEHEPKLSIIIICYSCLHQYFRQRLVINTGQSIIVDVYTATVSIIADDLDNCKYQSPGPGPTTPKMLKELPRKGNVPITYIYIKEKVCTFIRLSKREFHKSR